MQALNGVGYGAASAATNSVTPTAGPTVPGAFDLVVVLAGQSNMAGQGQINPALDTGSPDIWQYGSNPERPDYRQVVLAENPLAHPNVLTSTRLGPGLRFAKEWVAANPGKRVLLVPSSYGGTGLTGTSGVDARWNPSVPGDLYTAAIDQANRAIAACSGPREVVLLWAQGERDGDSGKSQALYTSKLREMVAGMRAGITNAANAAFITSSMLPEGLGNGARPGIDRAHKEVCSSIPYATFFTVSSGFDEGDQTHYNAAGDRARGVLFATALPVAQARSPSAVPGSLLNLAVIPSTTSAVLSWFGVWAGGYVSDYSIQYKESSAGTWSDFSRGISTVATATVPSLNPGTSYDFRVAGVNSNGVGAYSGVVTVSTLAASATVVRMTGRTGLVESGNAATGLVYTATGPVAWAGAHAGISDRKLEAAAAGSVQATLGAVNAGSSAMLGALLAQTDPAYSDGAAGVKWGIVDDAGTYKVVVDGAAAFVAAGVTTLTRQAGDVLRLSRTSAGTWSAGVARSATPTVFTQIHVFAAVSTAAAFFTIGASVTAGAVVLSSVTGIGIAASSNFISLTDRVLTAETGDDAAGLQYVATATTDFVTNRSGVSSKRLPSGVAGGLQCSGNSYSTSNGFYLLGVITSQTNPVWSAAGSYKFGGAQHSSGSVRAIVDGATVTAGVTAWSNQTGDVMKVERDAQGVWTLSAARAAAPTTFTLLYTFAETYAGDVWFGTSIAANNGTKTIGPLVGVGAL